MKFKSIEDAESYFNKSEKLPIGFEMPDYWVKYEEKPEMGEWMLFRHIDGDKKLISPLILALIVGHTIWDQSLVLEYVREWRGWEVNSSVFNKYANAYYPITFEDQKVRHVQFWTDDILVIGHWKTKPTYRQIRQSLLNNVTK